MHSPGNMFLLVRTLEWPLEHQTKKIRHISVTRLLVANHLSSHCNGNDPLKQFRYVRNFQPCSRNKGLLKYYEIMAKVKTVLRLLALIHSRRGNHSNFAEDLEGISFILCLCITYLPHSSQLSLLGCAAAYKRFDG